MGLVPDVSLISTRLQALSMCVICGRFIFYFAEFNVWYNTEVFYRILIACFKENDKIASLIYL